MGPDAMPSQQLQFARRAVLEGAPVPEGLLRAPLQRSWERTRASGLRPGDRTLFQHLVTSQEMRRVQNNHHALIELAAADMEQLWLSIRSPQWVVLLTDTQGTVVHSIGDDGRAPRELRWLHCGRRLSENELGTNAPALVASEPEAVEVKGEEHFLDELSRFSCAAAPIFGLDGRVAAILDVTGLDMQFDARGLSRVCTVAHSIEARLFEQADDGLLIRMHEDPRFLGSPAQGLLLVREDGHVMAANRAAKEMIGPAASAGPMHLSRIFDAQTQLRLRPHRSLIEHTSDGPLATQPAYTLGGARFFANVSERIKRRRTSPMPRAVPLDRQNRELDPHWQSAFERASRVFPSGLPIFIHGETGCGKEWFTRALHQAHHPDKPFAAVNCAALAEGVAEAELFGHVEGAYTGSRKGGAKGRIEQAHGGTLFLDEIGDMPLHLQTRLLRVLEDRSLMRVGGHVEIRLDVRVVSASHRNLADLVASGAFREDLYFRLNGLKVGLPALRERRDLDVLIDRCLLDAAASGQAAAQLIPDVRRFLHQYAWPGNIRQLKHVIHVGSILAGPGGSIGFDMLPEELLCAATAGDCDATPIQRSTAAPRPDAAQRIGVPQQSLSALQRHLVGQALSDHGGNVSATARSLGISRTTVYKHLRA